MTVSVIAPVVAPLGTVTVSDVVVAADTVAVVPLNFTTFADAVVLKFVPEIVTVVPTGAMVGEKLVMVGAGATMNEPALVTAGPACTRRTNGYVPNAGLGKLKVSAVDVAAVIVANTPPMDTEFWLAVVLKLVPLSVTTVPDGPAIGENPVMVGNTKNVSLLVTL